jgi:transcriptional regulator NrdR family protein
MLVLKRDKSAQTFSEKKVKDSIRNAFKSCNSKLYQDKDSLDKLDKIVEEVYSKLDLKEGIRTETIQSQIEVELMKLSYYKEAKFFIIWRHINYYQNYLGNKVKFMRSYLSAVNAATGSKYDANANVTEKNVTTLSGELFKKDIIKLNRYRMYSKISEMYGEDLAKEYIRQLESHELYKHDESSELRRSAA